MSPESRIHDILSRWERSRAEGRALHPEELCRHCPELVDEVRRRIGLLEPAVRNLQNSTLPELAHPATSHAADHDKETDDSAGSSAKPSFLLAQRIPFLAEEVRL
ncbi:MAG: hypothetical protein FJ271_03705 [Planctomycetes bacterium]|nr:hypothetical protein [Planctomycetota bacterium]